MTSNHINFDMQSLENTSKAIDVKEIKKMLVSGVREKILESVKQLQEFLMDNTSLEKIIRCDITEFLCDAMIPFDDNTLRAIYKCLGEITKHKEFYIQSHTCFVVESLVRSIHVLNKNSNDYTNLAQSFIILVHIVQGHNTFSVPLERKTTENILQLLSVVLSNKNFQTNILCQIGALIVALCDSKVLPWSEEFLDILMRNCCIWMDLVQEMTHSVHPMKENLIYTCCILCQSMLRCLLSIDFSFNDNTLEHQEKLKSDLSGKASTFLINNGNYFMDHSVNTINTSPDKIEKFLQAILYVYSTDVKSEKSRLAHSLSEMGFLQFVTRVISFADFGTIHQLRQLGVIALSGTVMLLSNDVFSKVWNDCYDNYREEMKQGFSLLPLDASQWLDALVNPCFSPSCKIALLSYLYFYCMTAKSQSILETIYPSFVNFINSVQDIEISTFLVKIIWFIFVMSQLSCNRDTPPESEKNATAKIVSILEYQEDLSVVYTHHPGLLYWAFTSNISRNIQFKIVHLWLRNKSPNCKEVDGLIEKSVEMRVAILEILQTECGQVLDSAFSSLKSILSKSGNCDLAASIWFLLPQILAKYITDSSSEKNVDYIVELATLKIPENIDITKIIRVASLLPEVFLKSELLSVVPSLVLTFELLDLGFKLNDFRVMHIFLRHSNYIKKIVKGMESNIIQISVVSMKIVDLLWEKIVSSDASWVFLKVDIRAEVFLKIVESNFVEVLAAGLELCQKVVSTSFRSSIFVIKDLNSDFVEILFSEIINICIKNFQRICMLCWKCLTCFLHLNSLQESFVKNEFITHPLVHELIKFHLPNLQESKEMKEFFILWLEENSVLVDDPCFGRKIFGEFFKDTVQNVKSYLDENLMQKDLVIYEKLLKYGGTSSNLV